MVLQDKMLKERGLSVDFWKDDWQNKEYIITLLVYLILETILYIPTLIFASDLFAVLLSLALNSYHLYLKFVLLVYLAHLR